MRRRHFAVPSYRMSTAFSRTTFLQRAASAIRNTFLQLRRTQLNFLLNGRRQPSLSTGLWKLHLRHLFFCVAFKFNCCRNYKAHGLRIQWIFHKLMDGHFDLCRAWTPSFCPCISHYSLHVTSYDSENQWWSGLLVILSNSFRSWVFLPVSWLAHLVWWGFLSLVRLAQSDVEREGITSYSLNLNFEFEIISRKEIICL